MSILKKVGLVFISVVLPVAVTGVALSFAQGPDTQDTAPGFQERGPGNGNFGFDGQRGPRGGQGQFNRPNRGGPGGPGGFGPGKLGGPEHDVFLAEALGITVEELDAAKEKARELALAQALEDGTITQEQVDQMQAMQALKAYLDKEAIMLSVLGITAEDLQAYKDAGTPMPDVIAELGLDPTALRESMQTAHQEAIAQAVADGVISQELADEILSGELRGGPGGPGGQPGHRGKRGPGGPRGGQGSQGFGF